MKRPLENDFLDENWFTDVDKYILALNDFIDHQIKEKNKPQKIYLQTGFVDGNSINKLCKSSITLSTHRINDSDIEYNLNNLNMSKDPAFLFYSKDFYEGTRTMLPEERACYIDLLVYQNQHGIIPTELKRVLMYCSGIDKATLEATLEAKFKLTDEGWLNGKLLKVMTERKDFSSKMSINGKVGQLWKKARKTNNYEGIRKLLTGKTNASIHKELIEKYNGDLEAMLEALLKHLVNVDEDVNADGNYKEDMSEISEIINLDPSPIDILKRKSMKLVEEWKTEFNLFDNIRFEHLLNSASNKFELNARWQDTPHKLLLKQFYQYLSSTHLSEQAKQKIAERTEAKKDKYSAAPVISEAHKIIEAKYANK